MSRKRRTVSDDVVARVATARAQFRPAHGSRWHSPGARRAFGYSMLLAGLAAPAAMLVMAFLVGSGWTLMPVIRPVAIAAVVLVLGSFAIGWRARSLEREWRSIEVENQARARDAWLATDQQAGTGLLHSTPGYRSES